MLYLPSSRRRRPRCRSVAMKTRRVGRANDSSYVVIEGVLSERQLASARAYVGSDEVQAALNEGILFDEKSEDEADDEQGQENAGNGRAPPKARGKRKRATRQRKSRIAWLERADDDESPRVPEWLHARLRLAAKATHARLGDKLCPIGVDSTGRWTPRYEPLQYAEYGPGAHYASWHTDAERNSDDPEDARGVTVVLLLSDKSAFTGGRFQVRSESTKAHEVKLRAGDAIGFPSQRLEHRVSKIASGLRQSLVCWATRPSGVQ
jgi:hypothetical protein